MKRLIEPVKGTLLLLLLAPFIRLSAQQQNLKADFTPLKSKGTLPEIFTKDIKKAVKDEIASVKSTNDKDKNLKAVFLAEVNYEVERTVKSGGTLMNDEITDYLNKLADVTFAKDPELRKQLNIFAIKSPGVNAFTFHNGYIFFFLGIIAQAESEAQLSYILTHEATHFVKKHSINKYVANRHMEKNFEGKNKDELISKKCQYSKEFESECDLEGFKIYETTNYDLDQAPKTFDMLEYSRLPFELIEFKKSFFENENYKLPQKYFLEEVSPIANNSAEDDSKSTHPNTAKRRTAIQQIVKGKENKGRVKSILGEDKFLYIRDLARLEICRLYLIHRDYLSALYSAYIMANKYPDNHFIQQIISKCLYALVLQRAGDLKFGDESDMGGIPFYNDIESYPQQLYYFNQRIPDNELSILATNYIYRAHKKFPNDKVLNIMTDSMFTFMYYTEWGITDFVRGDKKAKPAGEQKSKTDMIAEIQSNSKNDTTAYYRKIYLDLFKTDEEFSKKFPASGGHERIIPYTPKSYKVKNNIKKLKEVDKIEKVLSVKPFFHIVSEKGSEYDEIAADENQEKLIGYIGNCATKQQFEVVTLDPGLLSSTDVDKMNDYSVICDWIYERADGKDNYKNKVPVFNTDEIDKVIAKYGTNYVLRTGVFVVKDKRTETFFYAVIYDLKANKLVYLKEETFKGQPSMETINANICDVFEELKTGRKD